MANVERKKNGHDEQDFGPDQVVGRNATNGKQVERPRRSAQAILNDLFDIAIADIRSAGPNDPPSAALQALYGSDLFLPEDENTPKPNEELIRAYDAGTLAPNRHKWVQDQIYSLRSWHRLHARIVLEKVPGARLDLLDP